MPARQRRDAAVLEAAGDRAARQAVVKAARQAVVKAPRQAPRREGKAEAPGRR